MILAKEVGIVSPFKTIGMLVSKKSNIGKFKSDFRLRLKTSASGLEAFNISNDGNDFKLIYYLNFNVNIFTSNSRLV